MRKVLIVFISLCLLSSSLGFSKPQPEQLNSEEYYLHNQSMANELYSKLISEFTDQKQSCEFPSFYGGCYFDNCKFKLNT